MRLVLAAPLLVSLVSGCSLFTDFPLPPGEGEVAEGEGDVAEGEEEPPVDGPDLALSPVGIAPRVIYGEFAADACEIGAGTIRAAGARALLAFDVVVDNAGTTAGALVDEPGACGADAVAGALRWRVLSLAGDVAAEGALALPAATLNTAPGASATVAVGPAPLLVDVTDVPGGDYRLELTLDPTLILDPAASNNVVTLPIALVDMACSGVVCGEVCCAADSCQAGVCMMPDLGVDAEVLHDTAQIFETYVGAGACEVQEGCVGAPGDRRLLKFSTTTPNLGNADLVVGPPSDNPLFSHSQCHDHYHFDRYANYRLLTQTGEVAAVGHKQAFCLMDLERADPAAGRGRYTCSDQGISKGWADTYARELDCQWIDITGVAGGDYVLEVHVNYDGVLPELDYTNNIARVPVTIPEDPNACVPSAEVCGNGLDENCDNVADDGCAPLTDNDTCADGFTISGSGTFTGEILADNAPDLTPSCGGAGGELFFRFHVASRGIVYLSSYGSAIDTTLSVFRDEGCAATPTESLCVDDSCGEQGAGGAHFAGFLDGGPYVAVVKAKQPGAAGLVQFKIQNSGCNSATLIDGPELFGDTSDATNNTAPSCGAGGGGDGGDGPDELWYFTTCPGAHNIELQTCGGGLGFDSLLEIREGSCRGPAAPGGCNDDVVPGQRICSIVEPTLQGDGAGDGLWFVLVDGFDADDDGAYPIRMTIDAAAAP